MYTKGQSLVSQSLLDSQMIPCYLMDVRLEIGPLSVGIVERCQQRLARTTSLSGRVAGPSFAVQGLFWLGSTPPFFKGIALLSQERGCFRETARREVERECSGLAKQPVAFVMCPLRRVVRVDTFVGLRRALRTHNRHYGVPQCLSKIREVGVKIHLTASQYLSVHLPSDLFHA